ncbi:hypothetical protein D3C87_1169610 [compost metagenome]
MLALTKDCFDVPTLESLPRFQCRRQRPLLQVDQSIANAGFTEGIDPHQQGAGVILAAGQVRGADQRLRGTVQIRLITQDRGNRGVAQNRPDPVAEQDEALIETQFTVEKIQHQMLIQAQRPLEHMLHARLIPDVIFADSLQIIPVPAINPAIADVSQGKPPATQHQSAHSGQ